MTNLSNKNKISLIGTNKLISQQLEEKGFVVSQYGRNTNPQINFNSEDLKNQFKQIIDNEKSEKFIIMSGYLQSKKIMEQSRYEITKSFHINSIGPLLFAEYLFQKKSKARLIIIGSESGYKGSYDLSYALSKSSLKLYVKQKKLKKNQQLLLVSPSTIGDFGMTTRRKDQIRLIEYKEIHPKERFLFSNELTELIINLFASTIYLTNVEICINGGKFCLMENY